MSTTTEAPPLVTREERRQISKHERDQPGGVLPLLGEVWGEFAGEHGLAAQDWYSSSRRGEVIRWTEAQGVSLHAGGGLRWGWVEIALLARVRWNHLEAARDEVEAFRLAYLQAGGNAFSRAPAHVDFLDVLESVAYSAGEYEEAQVEGDPPFSDAPGPLEIYLGLDGLAAEIWRNLMLEPEHQAIQDAWDQAYENGWNERTHQIQCAADEVVDHKIKEAKAERKRQ